MMASSDTESQVPISCTVETESKVPISCSVESLNEILTEPSGGMMMLPSRGMDEVYPGVYIGDKGSACRQVDLERRGITHILNTAVGCDDSFHVNISPDVYKNVGLKYMAIEATDSKDCLINEHFSTCAEYIEQALTTEGKVLAHCREGASRSATVVIAFLMLKRQMRVTDAVRLVRKSREIAPNDGFLQKLCELNDSLDEQGHFDP